MHWGADSKVVVTTGQDGNLIVWNGVTANKMQCIALKSSYVMSVGIEQSKGNLIACGGLDNLIAVYRRSQPDKAMEMAFHDGFLSCCRFMSETELLSASGDSNIIRWDLNTAKPVTVFGGHSADAMWISLQPGSDNKVFASGSVDKTIKIWDVRAGNQAQQTFYGPESDINCVEFMPSSPSTLACCSQDNSIRIFDMRANNQLSKMGGRPSPDPFEPGFTRMSFSRSGRIIFAGHADGCVYAFDVLGGKVMPAYTLTAAHERNCSCVGVSPQGNALATAGWDGIIKIWA